MKKHLPAWFDEFNYSGIPVTFLILIAHASKFVRPGDVRIAGRFYQLGIAVPMGWKN